MPTLTVRNRPGPVWGAGTDQRGGLSWGAGSGALAARPSSTLCTIFWMCDHFGDLEEMISRRGSVLLKTVFYVRENRMST